MPKTLFHIILVCALFLTSVTLSAQSYTDHRNRQVDSLEQVLATEQPTGANLVRTLSGLMWGYQQNSVRRSMDYARRCIEAATAIDEWATVADGYKVLAINHYKLSQYDEAADSYNHGLEAAERMREFPEKYDGKQIDNAFSSIYGNLGNLYNIQGRYHEAVEYYIMALKIFEKHAMKEMEALVYENVGEMYRIMGNYPQAETNFLKADSLAHLTGDSLRIAASDWFLSSLHLDKKEYDKALQYAESAHTYYGTHPEEGEDNAETLNLLAQIYLDGYDDVVQAETYARQALELADELGFVKVKSGAQAILSSIHLKRGEWRAAERAALEALAADDSEPGNTLSLYGILAKAHAYLGEAGQSALYFDRYDSLQVLLVTKHYQFAIRDMEAKYETEKIQTRVATLEDEKRFIVWLGIAAGAVLLLLLAALFFIWRWTAQKRRFAEQQIIQLEQEKQLVATQALLDGEIAERTRLARDLHDSLGSMLTGMKMNIEGIRNDALKGKIDIGGIDNTLKTLGDSSHELRRVAHHLMPDSLSRFGLNTAIGDFCSTLPGVNFSWYGDEEPLDPKLETMIYRTVHELVNNALKHAEASQILVQVIQNPGRIAFTVQDDGRGFDPEAASPGMGLSNVRARVASFGGAMDIVSSGDGTEINIELRIEN